MTAVTDDASPRGSLAFALVEPPLQDRFAGENGAPVRRSATAETADLLADLVVAGVRTLAFVRSRRGVEAVATSTRRALAEVDPELAGRVAAYRGGYLPEERRALERALQSGRLLGLAATNALELGVDIAGLDAVLITGFPGTLASMWQQAGRAGRAGQGALAVLVARDDPLDTYLVHHPEALFGRPVEATVLDPDNPYVLGPHLCAAAAELPLTDGRRGDVRRRRCPTSWTTWSARGLLRRRPAGWFWTRRERATALADLRGTGGAPVRDRRGAAPGDCWAPSTTRCRTAPCTAVRSTCTRARPTWSASLDLDDCVALVARAEPDYSHLGAGPHRHHDRRDRADPARRRAWRCTSARSTSPTRWSASSRSGWAPARCSARSRSTCRCATCAPARSGGPSTPGQLERAGLGWTDIPGAAHAAEHASIGLLPLFATCDRWDIGGVSTALHADTGLTTVFVYDGHPGGAGFAERGFRPWPARGCRPPATRSRLRLRDRLPVVRPVAQVRQRQRTAGQGRRGAAAAGRPGRAADRRSVSGRSNRRSNPPSGVVPAQRRPTRPPHAREGERSWW